jgi:hypothetical protein
LQWSKRWNVTPPGLDGVTEIIKRYEERWQKTGEKYNLFKVAGIAYKEVNMCRVLADLLNPQGKHGRGSRYLSLFWEAIVPKLPGGLSLDVARAKVRAEYVIDENRRIDIVLEDGTLFVPIEVKIGAPDLSSQAADYFAFAKTKNKDVHVPVLYLTIDGHEPSDLSKADIGKDDYVCISFKNEILVWLEACARESATEVVIPLRENLKQLIAAVKSLCDKSEDTDMENEIFKLVTKDDDSVKAALAIRGAMDFKSRALEAFIGPITKLVEDGFHGTVECNVENDWNMMQVEVMGGNYVLDVNYDWEALYWEAPYIEVCVDGKERDRQFEKRLVEEMTKWTNQAGTPEDTGFAFYGTRYPGLDPADKEWYFYRLAKLYTEHPQEVADKIIAIANTLEDVTA